MPCTPMADRASRTSSSLNGLMIAVTSFMNELPVWVMGFEALELVEALQRDGRHGLAGHVAKVPEHGVGRLISASLDACFEAVGGKEGTRYGDLLVLRTHRAKVEAIFVVERLDTYRPAELRSEHIVDVARNAAVLRLDSAAVYQRGEVVLAHA